MVGERELDILYFDSRQRPVVASCEHGAETSDSIDGEFDQIDDC
jgi:hypothetical protein